MKKAYFCLTLCVFGCTTTTIVNTGTMNTGRFIYNAASAPVADATPPQPIVATQSHPASEVKRIVVKKGCSEFHIPNYGKEPKLPLDIKDIMVKNPSKGLELLTKHIHDQSLYITDVKAKVASETKAHLKSCK